MRILSLIALLTSLLAACQALPFTALSNLPSGSVLFQDTFADPTSGWPRLPQAGFGQMEYLADGYRILVEQPDSLLVASPGLHFKDAHLEVEVTHLSDPADDLFGLACRIQDDRNYYFLVISSDGYYGIGKVVDGQTMLLSAEALLPSEVIRQGQATNHLRAACQGEQLTLSVNGIEVAQVKDSQFDGGEAGLVAGSFTSPGTDVLFDNFSVTKP